MTHASFSVLVGTAVVLLVTTALTNADEQDNSGHSPLRTMTFNIRYDNPRDGKDVWANRKDWVADIIRDRKVDVVGLQEALRHQVQDLEERLTDYAWYGVGRDDGREKGELVPIFYRKDRFEQLDAGAFWLSETPDEPGSKSWDAAITRVTTWLKLKDRNTGQTWFVYNTHFDHRGEQARKKSAQLMLRHLAALDSSFPLVFMGDFNCKPDSEPYRILTNAKADSGEKPQNAFSLHDAISISATPPRGPDSTWNGFREVVPGQRIDFIFVNDAVRVRSHHILDDQKEGRFPSDHLPVLTELLAPTAVQNN